MGTGGSSLRTSRDRQERGVRWTQWSAPTTVGRDRARDRRPVTRSSESVDRHRTRTDARPPQRLDDGRDKRPRRSKFFRRRIVAVVLAGFLIWLAVSLGGALTDPSLGASVSARFAEWAREHGGASTVNWIENEWYTHHPPARGGKPPAGSIRVPKRAPVVVSTGPVHLPPPAPIVPVASPPIPGEGQWSPAGGLIAEILPSTRPRCGRIPSTPATSWAWPGWIPSC